MREVEHDIKPGGGLGPLTLGMREGSVRSLLGDPPDIRETDYGDGQMDRDWTYESLNLSLTFSEDDEFRLGAICTSFEWATLRGTRIVALTEQELLQGEFGGLGPPVLEDDLEESGKVYSWGTVNLSCWVVDGAVVSVSIMPLYDDTGDIPQWPKESANMPMHTDGHSGRR